MERQLLCVLKQVGHVTCQGPQRETVDVLVAEASSDKCKHSINKCEDLRPLPTVSKAQCEEDVVFCF